MFKVVLTIFTFASSLDKLQENIAQIIATTRSKANCKLMKLDYLSQQALNTTLPLGKNFLPLERTLTTNSTAIFIRSEEHTSELQSRINLVCRLLLEKKKQK